MEPYYLVAAIGILSMSMTVTLTNVTSSNSTLFTSIAMEESSADSSEAEYSADSSDEKLSVDDGTGRIFILVNNTLASRPNFAVSITLIGLSIFYLWGAAVQNYPLTAGRSLDDSNPHLFNPFDNQYENYKPFNYHPKRLPTDKKMVSH